VSRRARNRAAAAAAVALVAGIVLAGGQVTGAFALFTGETTNQASTFSGGWIPAPSSLSDSITGGSNSTISLGWTSGNSTTMPNGNSNPVTAQQLQLADGGSGGSASCGSYGNEGSQLGAAATSTTDNLGSVPAANWLCYQMVSKSGSGGAGPWTSSATFGAIRLLVPVSIVFTGNSNGRIDSGETIKITFNQDVASSSVHINNGICEVKGTSSNGFLILGYTGTCGAGASYQIGQISGITIQKAGSDTASVSVSGPLVTITATSSDAPSQGITTGGTFVASPTITASSGSPAACTSASGPTCTVSPSGSF
jgi:hypothetical protein